MKHHLAGLAVCSSLARKELAPEGLSYDAYWIVIHDPNAAHDNS